MTNLERIRAALDRAVNLGNVDSGKLKISPEGIYRVFLSNSNQSNYYFIELELNYGKIISIKSYNSNSSSENFKIRVHKITSGQNDNYYLYYSLESPKIFVENIKEAVEIVGNPPTASNTVLEQSAPTNELESYQFNRTYFVGSVENVQGADISGLKFKTQTLEIKNANIEDIRITATKNNLTPNSNSKIYVPNLYVENVGFDNVSTDTIKANQIECARIKLVNADGKGWMFTSEDNDGSNVTTLTLTEYPENNASQSGS